MIAIFDYSVSARGRSRAIIYDKVVSLMAYVGTAACALLRGASAVHLLDRRETQIHVGAYRTLLGKEAWSLAHDAPSRGLAATTTVIQISARDISLRR